MESSQESTQSKKESILKFGLVLVFLGYVLCIPQIIPSFVPCLRFPSGQYEFIECNAILAIDWYLKLSVAGFIVISILLFYFFRFTTSKLVLGILVITMAIAIVGGYYWYIPQAESSVKGIHIYLDTLYDGPAVELNI